MKFITCIWNFIIGLINRKKKWLRYSTAVRLVMGLSAVKNYYSVFERLNATATNTFTVVCELAQYVRQHMYILGNQWKLGQQEDLWALGDIPENDFYKWASAWDFQQCGICDQQSLRPACAYAQTDQSLCKSLEYSMSVKLLTKTSLEVLSLKWDCRGSSESTLVKMSNCWKSHAAAQIFREKYYQFQYSSYKFAGSAVSVRPYMDK